MDKRTTNRREFLKLLGASVAAAGLSHFQFLNLGVRPAFAQDMRCADPNGDQCIPQVDPDVCIEPFGGDGDVCGSLDPGGVDICGAGSPDECNPPKSVADICDEQDGDICRPPDDADACEWLQTGQPEAPDKCEPPENPDVCPDSGGDGDVCQPPADPDTCEPWMTPPEPDSCNPAGGDPDVCDPNDQAPDPPSTAVRLTSFGARPAQTATITSLPMLGGVAAGAAFVWVLRRRMKHSLDDNDTG